MMTKEMFRLNKYYYVDDSVLRSHREYPPLTQIWQYMWCKLIGIFKESSLYNAKLTLCLSVMLSVVGRIIDPELLDSTFNNWELHICKRNKNGIMSKIERAIEFVFVKTFQSIPISLLVIVLAAFPTLADGSMYRTIYAEGTMVILTVYTIICVLFPVNDKTSDLITYSVTISSLVLVKQIGILFAAISVLILAIIYIETRILLNRSGATKIIKYSDVSKDILVKMSVGILSAFIPWFIWNRVSKIHTTAGQFDSSRFSVAGIMDVIHGGGTPAQYQCINDYSHALFTWKLTWIPGTGYIVQTIVLLIALFSVFIYKKRKAEQSVRKMDCDMGQERTIDLGAVSALIIALLLTVIGYGGIMQVLYLFGFSEDEMRVLACYTRYMNSMLGIWELVVTFVLFSTVLAIKVGCSTDADGSNTFLKSLNNKNTLTPRVCAMAIIIYVFLIGISGLKYEFMPGVFTTGSEGLFASDAKKIRDYTPEESSVYFVDTMGNDSATNIVRFLADGRNISEFYVAPKASDYENVVRYMREFEYIYLDNIDDEFISTYGGLFDGEHELSRQQMYKIDSDGDAMILSYMDMSE
ncbi:MAG: hypothetical protein K5868_02510 [Lachnospiraceae bacterium]|nr:hypothetical protein [Lachnospiraceae bacterium]